MKYLTSIFFVIAFASCSGTKKVIEKKPQVVAKTETLKTNDSLSKKEYQKKIIKVLETNKEEKESIEEIIIEHDTTFEAFNHNMFNELLKKHVSSQGHVNYLGFKKDANKLKNYITTLSNKTPNKDWNKEDKLAYWINAYNAMTIDLILRNYPVKSIKDIDKPWDKRFWKLGNKWYNLNDIEHQILRKMDEPRIHFAIVCASISCPKLHNEAYSASNLEEQLTKVTKVFLLDTNRNEISQNSLKLSKIFQWFAKDFKQNGSIIDFISQYSDVEISSKAKKSFKTYNWDLND